MRIAVVLSALVALLAGTVAQGAVYRWVDSKGVVHYGDTPGANAVSVNVNTGRARAEEMTYGPLDDPNLTPEQKAQRAAECEQKKKQLKTYENAARIIETDSLGREKEFTEDERKQLVAKTQQKVSELCGTPLPVPSATEGSAPPPGG